MFLVTLWRVFKKNCVMLAAVLAAVLITAPAHAADINGDTHTSQFRSINDITQALNPLDVLGNHDGIKRSIDLNIRFNLNAFTLLPTAQRQIEVLAEALNGDRLSAYGIHIIGHTDAQGDAAQNQQLSEQRANAVKQALEKIFGVASYRLHSLGKGESALIDKLAPDDARHRRVELVAIPIEKMSMDAQEVPEQENLEQETGQRKIRW